MLLDAILYFMYCCITFYLCLNIFLHWQRSLSFILLVTEPPPLTPTVHTQVLPPGDAALCVVRCVGRARDLHPPAPLGVGQVVHDATAAVGRGRGRASGFCWWQHARTGP